MIRKVFRALEHREFRNLWLGACTSSIGTWMQKLAQSWLVLQISGNPFFLGLDSFLGEIPVLMFSLLGGVVADRVSRRNMLIASQVLQMSCAFLLALLFALNVVNVWYIMALSFVVGLAQAFGGPAYQALIPSLVSPEDLSNAIAMNSIQFNLARVIGPVLGGLALTQLGATWCFVLNGLSFLAVIASLLSLRPTFVPQRTGQSILDSMKQGVRFIRLQPGMEALIALAFLMTLLALPLLVFLPVFAKDVFHQGPRTYTILLAVSGIGSVAGAIAVAAMGNMKRMGRAALLILILFGAVMVAFCVSRNLVVSCIFLFLAGAALIAVLALTSSLVQHITADNMRGRVMSVYNVAFRGGMPIGALASGALVTSWTAPVVLAVNGVLLTFVGLYFLFVQRRIAAL